MNNDNLLLYASKEDICKFAEELQNGLFYEEKIDDLVESLTYYNSIGLYGVIKNNFVLVSQNVELSYARYQYLNSIGVGVDVSNWQELFLLSCDFKSKYNISKDELLDKYHFEDYRESLKKEKEKSNSLKLKVSKSGPLSSNNKYWWK